MERRETMERFVWHDEHAHPGASPNQAGSPAAMGTALACGVQG